MSAKCRRCGVACSGVTERRGSAHRRTILSASDVPRDATGSVELCSHCQTTAVMLGGVRVMREADMASGGLWVKPLVVGVPYTSTLSERLGVAGPEEAGRAFAPAVAAKPRGAAIRKCLGCETDFESKHIHNRMCDRCRRAA